MADDKVPTSKGPSRGQAWILVTAGIVLTLGGCGMPMSQRFVGVGMLLVGAGLFGSGLVLLVRANSQSGRGK